MIDVAAWWRSAEATSSGEGGDDPLANALRHAMRREVDEANALLANLVEPDAALTAAVELLRLKLRAISPNMEELRSAAREMGALASSLPIDDPTYARARHEEAALLLRATETAAAEAMATEALVHLEPEAVQRRSWIAETLAMAYQRSGAWHEARRAFAFSFAEKEALSDAIGVAITAGSWGRMELELGNPETALDLAQRALAGADLPSLTCARLLTLAVEASLESADRPAIADELDSLIGGLSDEDYLVGYGALALGRRSWATGGAAPEWQAYFARAAISLRLPYGRTLHAYYERLALEPDPSTDDAWLAEQQVHYDALGLCTASEVLAKLYVAERQAERDRAAASRALDALAIRVAEANNATWFEWIDERGSAFDPEGATRRRLRRYLGPQVERLETTERLEASIVFADLVGFTRRSVELTTEEVMETVRSVFELTSTLLQEHHLHPLQYLGDGLLAIAFGNTEGEEHGARALAFARQLTRRMHEVTRARGAMAARGELASSARMNVRCGVARGPVVFGPLGNLLRTELLAIGLTTNRAARLQGQAEPDEVVCDAALSPDVGEYLSITPKGFDTPVHARRLRLDS